jgi:hypothetical protein
MKRKKEHQRILTKILNNERLSPNRALLGSIVSQMLDAETEAETELLTKIILSFVDGKGIRWTDTANGDEGVSRANEVDLAAQGAINTFLDEMREKRRLDELARAAAPTS